MGSCGGQRGGPSGCRSCGDGGVFPCVLGPGGCRAPRLGRVPCDAVDAGVGPRGAYRRAGGCLSSVGRPTTIRRGVRFHSGSHDCRRCGGFVVPRVFAGLRVSLCHGIQGTSEPASLTTTLNPVRSHAMTAANPDVCRTVSGTTCGSLSGHFTVRGGRWMQAPTMGCRSVGLQVGHSLGGACCDP